MQTITLSEYGRVISESELGNQILEDINAMLIDNESIIIDFTDVISMATFCSKQIFGQLYISMTPQDFFKRITIKNASEDMRIIVRLGIEKALDDQS
ncbi:DUF4325 domain-containing protein [Fibrisoma montanum]|uniref:DUF4325 domain-containing protein n=1 Tax=Fibrisoma montanum TaxID=2305895 RepID=A0A418MEA8_9BACT|nr:STAS-like domain-containing protein [Fibrisoma montanum]RIV25121.1 DUF4325 domain-containing protein [Fibrisoma montanum]